MSAAKHTPGPWSHDTRGYPHADVRGANGRAVAVTWGVCCGQPKTEAGIKAQKDEGRANARLIAAAPDLLEALRTADKTFAENELLSSHAARKEIRAAIAKAEGAQQ